MRASADRGLVERQDDALGDVVVEPPTGEGVVDVEQCRQRGQVDDIGVVAAGVQRRSIQAAIVADPDQHR